MRFRGKSIRRKIVALLLVPLLALTAVWGYASVLMGREVLQLFHVSSVVEKIAYPTEDAVRALEQERRQTLIYLADPRASDALGALRRTRIATDDALATLRGNVKTSKVRDALDRDDSADLTTVLDGFRSVDSVRESVDGSNLTRAQALDLYNRVVDPCYALLATLDVVDTTELDKEYRALVNAARARELFSREDALLGSALVTGRVTRTELRNISELIAQRGAVYEVSTDQLPAEERDRYDSFWQGAPTASLREAEKFVQNTDPDEMPPGVTAKSWDSLGGRVLDRLAALDDAATDELTDESEDATHSLWAVAFEASRLDEIVDQVVRSLEFSHLAKYAFGLAQTFNAFYHRYPILNEEQGDRKRWRAAGVAYVRAQLTRALDLMGIDVPNRM